MKKTKFFILLISSLFILNGCIGGNDEETIFDTEKPGFQIYEEKNFTINLPEEWDIIEQNEFTSNVPSETLVIFRNNIKNEVFTANINISKKAIEQNIDVINFVKSSQSQIKNRLLNYKEINFLTKNINKGNEKINAIFIEFEGRQNANEPIIYFKQLNTIYNGIAYTITGSYLQNENENIVNSINEMLNSFHLN